MVTLSSLALNACRFKASKFIVTKVKIQMSRLTTGTATSGRSDAANLATDPTRLTTPTATIPSIGGSTRAGSTTKGNRRIPLPPGPSYRSRAAYHSDAHDRECSEVSMYSSTKSPRMAPLVRRMNVITTSPYGGISQLGLARKRNFAS